MESSEETGESNIDILQKDQENESYPLRKMDIIDNTNDKKEKTNELFQLKKFFIIIFIILCLIIALFLLNIFISNSNDYDEDYEKAKYKSKNKPNLKINTNQNQNQINIGDIKESNHNQNNNKKLNVGFIYSTLSGNGIARFMIVTGEYFLKTGKYNVFFITKPKSNRELYYNENINRIFAFNNHTLIKKAIQKEKIDILIVNNVFSPSLIKWYKSLGVKTIGIYHGVYMSAMFNNNTNAYRNWQHLELYDAYIHISADDYYYYKNLGFKRNIFVPNLYTFEPSESPSSNLTNHNIMMLGRLNDKKKGLIYAIKAMDLIVKEIPDARLNLVSSDGKTQELTKLIKDLHLTKNVFYIPFTPNIAEFFLDTSVFLFPSLTEAFPMALNEAKAYGLPCVTFDVSYSMPFQSGVIKVDTFDYKGLARETIKLLKDYDYRIKMGKEAKLSLNRFTNEKTAELWGRLFNSLLSGEKEFQQLRKEIENKYYNEKIAEEHMEKQLKYLKMYNKFFRCHSLKNFTNINYINNIEVCQNVNR